MRIVIKFNSSISSLRNFTKQKELLQDPVVEAVLLMKWYASRRILIFDLLLYMLFIIGMTAVILYSTKPVREEVSVLQKEESALVDLLLDRCAFLSFSLITTFCAGMVQSWQGEVGGKWRKGTSVNTFLPLWFLPTLPGTLST